MAIRLSALLAFVACGIVNAEGPGAETPADCPLSGRPDKDVIEAIQLLVKKHCEDKPVPGGESTADLGPLVECHWTLAFQVTVGLRGCARTALTRLLAQGGTSVLSKLAEILPRQNSASVGIAVECARIVGAEAVPALIDYAQSEHAKVRLWAAMSLGKITTNAEAAMPALIRLTEDASEDVAFQAIHALPQYHEAREEVLACCLKAIADPRRLVRMVAIRVGAHLSRRDPEFCQELLRMLEKGSVQGPLEVEERTVIAEALRYFPRHPLTALYESQFGQVEWEILSMEIGLRVLDPFDEGVNELSTYGCIGGVQALRGGVQKILVLLWVKGLRWLAAPGEIAASACE